MMDGGFPVYLLDDGHVLFAREDLGHVEFWERSVAAEVSRRFGVPLPVILDLPYCQRRGRVVGGVFYCGERLSRAEMRAVEGVLGMGLRLVYDDHERRCAISLGEFRSFLPAIP